MINVAERITEDAVLNAHNRAVVQIQSVDSLNMLLAGSSCPLCHAPFNVVPAAQSMHVETPHDGSLCLSCLHLDLPISACRKVHSRSTLCRSCISFHTCTICLGITRDVGKVPTFCLKLSSHYLKNHKMNEYQPLLREEPRFYGSYQERENESRKKGCFLL